MIAHKNNYVSVGYAIVDGVNRHLITMIEPGKMSFWLKDMDGNTLKYFYYDYVGINGGHSGEVFGEEAFVLQGDGKSVYLLNHKMSCNVKQINTTLYDTEMDLPEMAPDGSDWDVGDYAFVKSDPLYGKLGQYSICKISDSYLFWCYTGPLRGKFLGTIASPNNLPLTVDTDVNVGDYYTIAGEARTSYILEKLTGTKVNKWMEYSFSGVVDVHIQRASDCAKVTCNLVQWRNYIEMDFGAAISSDTKYIVKINNHLECSENLPLPIEDYPVTSAILYEDNYLAMPDFSPQEKCLTVWSVGKFVQVNGWFYIQRDTSSTPTNLYKVPEHLVFFDITDTSKYVDQVVGTFSLFPNNMDVDAGNEKARPDDNRPVTCMTHICFHFELRLVKKTISGKVGYYLCYNNSTPITMKSMTQVHVAGSWIKM